MILGTPDRLAFRAACARLATCGDDEARGIERELATWPDTVRCAPWSWLAALADGAQPERGWPLVRCLDLRHPVLDHWDPAEFPTARLFDAITTLELCTGPSWDHVLAHPEQFPALRSLWVGQTEASEDTDHPSLSSSPLFRQIESLDLGEDRWGSPPYTHLLYGEAMQFSAEQLHTLRTPVGDLADLYVLLASHPWPALRSLAVTFHGGTMLPEVPPAARDVLQRLDALTLFGHSEVSAAVLSACGEAPRRTTIVVYPFRGSVISASGVGLPAADAPLVTIASRLEVVDRVVTSLRLVLPDKVPYDRLGEVETLEVSGRDDDVNGIVKLLHHGRLDRLRHVRIASAGIHALSGDRVLEALLRSGVIRRLETLALQFAKTIQRRTFDLLASTELPGLRSLDLSGVGIGDAGAAVLGAMTWPALESLDLGANVITNAGLAALLRGAFPRLHVLDLGYNRIGGATLDAPAIPSLRSLRLRHNNVVDSDPRTPWFRAQARSLWSLDVSENALGPSALVALSELDMPELVELLVWNQRGGAARDADAARAFGSSPAFAHLDQVVGGVISFDNVCDGQGEPELVEAMFDGEARAAFDAAATLRAPALASVRLARDALDDDA